MSRTWKDAKQTPRRGHGRRRNITVRAVRRDPPDVRQLSRALLELAWAQLKEEQEAEAEQKRRAADSPEQEDGDE